VAQGEVVGVWRHVTAVDLRVGEACLLTCEPPLSRYVPFAGALRRGHI
jgi:hypothetical protein